MTPETFLPGDVSKADIRRIREERPTWLTEARDRYRQGKENAAHQAAAVQQEAVARDEATDIALGISDNDYCTGTDGCATCTPS